MENNTEIYNDKNLEAPPVLNESGKELNTFKLFDDYEEEKEEEMKDLILPDIFMIKKLEKKNLLKLYSFLSKSCIIKIKNKYDDLFSNNNDSLKIISNGNNYTLKISKKDLINEEDVKEENDFKYYNYYPRHFPLNYYNYNNYNYEIKNYNVDQPFENINISKKLNNYYIPKSMRESEIKYPNDKNDLKIHASSFIPKNKINQNKDKDLDNKIYSLDLNLNNNKENKEQFELKKINKKKNKKKFVEFNYSKK